MTLLGKLAFAALVAATSAATHAADAAPAAAPTAPKQAAAFTQAGWLNDMAALPPAFAPAAERLRQPAPPPASEHSPIPAASGMLVLAALLLLFAGRAPAPTPWQTIQVD
ncbi:hypothetical protein MJ904_08665 [Massilia sp. MB5]|uniref:hypothetical protein n=1 Tax=Massilia sp. MB5 TaxID=2919578 RepID=UPI001F0EEE1A|nr:hypothetical protein [Massilia sp. MB5]UMR32224.1 hypothetical protein MJ904_08665 [Massilia sp. MB5]